MKRLTQILFLVPAVILLTFTITPAQSVLSPVACSARRFLSVNDTGRQHFALSALSTAIAKSATGSADMCDWISKGCEEQADRVRQDCQVRGEGWGTGYSSCGCQALRSYKSCMDNYGCQNNSGYHFFIDGNQDCFIQ